MALLAVLFYSFGLGAKTMTDNDIKKYDYKVSIDLKECGMEFYINDVRLVSNGKRHSFNTTFGIGSFLKRKENKFELVLFSLNNDAIKFSDDTNCNFDFLARNRFEEKDLNSVFLINYRPKEDVKYNIEKALNYISSNVNWMEILKEPKIKLNEGKYKYYSVTGEFNIIQDFPEWKWVTSYQFDDKLEYFKDLPHEQQVKLKESYEELWNAVNRQDNNKIKSLFSEMLEESSAADGGSIDSYYESLGISMLFDKEQYELQPIRISDDTRVSKYLDNRVISLFKSPIAFKNLESGQFVAIKPKLRFDGEKFVISR